MPAPVSVIIPTLNAANTLGPCLGAVAAGLQHGIIAELIFADGGSDDDIAEIAELSGARLIQAPKGRGSQLGNAAKSAKADWLLFLHSDTVLAQNWPQTILSHIANHPDKAAYFRLKFDTNGFGAKMVASWANWRSRAFSLPFGDQGLLVSRQLYDQIGGYADIPLMEDVQIAKALKGKFKALDCIATTSAARYRQQGWIRRSFRNLAILMQYKLGVNPARLAQKYYR